MPTDKERDDGKADRHRVRLAGLPKYVVSSTLETPREQLDRADVVEEVPSLKRELDGEGSSAWPH
jgi:hypothetical protein